jgi:hypothetical protein
MLNCSIDLHLFVYILLPMEQGIVLRSPSHEAAKNFNIANGEGLKKPLKKGVTEQAINLQLHS